MCKFQRTLSKHADSEVCSIAGRGSFEAFLNADVVFLAVSQGGQLNLSSIQPTSTKSPSIELKT